MEIDAFLMDRYEVTQAVYAKLDPINGSHFKGPDLPTEMISWGKAALYCNLRSEAEGLEPCYNEFGECDFEADGYRLADRGGVGVRLPRGQRSYLRFRRRLRPAGPVRLVRRQLRQEDAPGRQEAAQRLGPVRHARQRGGVVQRLLRPGLLPAQSGQRIRAGRPKARRTCCAAAIGLPARTPAARPLACGEEPGFSDACFARDAIGFRCVRKRNSGAEQRDRNGTLASDCFHDIVRP